MVLTDERHGMCGAPSREQLVVNTPPKFDMLRPAARYQARRRRRATAAWIVAGSVLAVAGVASAAKGGNGGNNTGGDTSSVQSCVDLAGSYTMGDMRTHLGFDRLKNDLGLTGAGIDVAVIDTGISAVPSLDGPGQVIDGPDLSFDAVNENLRHNDLYGHGTNMAAIIAGRQSPFGSGVAPGARIVDVKVGAGDGSVDVSQVIAALDWIVDNRAANGMNIRVVNLSYSTDGSQSYLTDPLSYAVERAWRAGIVVVASGGNDGRGMHRLGNPAINPYVIAVGAAQKNASGWGVPNWSSTGDGTRNPDLVAPGAAILAPAVPGSYLAKTHPAATCIHPDSGQLFLRGNGTSQAAAVTAGAVALLLQQRPGLTPDQVKAILKSSTALLDLNSGNATQGGNGLLMAHDGKKKNPGGFALTPTPNPLTVTQTHAPATGIGTLNGARGTVIVGTQGDQLTGQTTAFGTTFNSAAHATLGATGSTWSNQIWMGASWSGGTWSGASWSGASWSGASWSGASWSGASWSGSSWSGASWSGASWSGASWS